MQRFIYHHSNTQMEKRVKRKSKKNKLNTLLSYWGFKKLNKPSQMLVLHRHTPTYFTLTNTQRKLKTWSFTVCFQNFRIPLLCDVYEGVCGTTCACMLFHHPVDILRSDTVHVRGWRSSRYFMSWFFVTKPRPHCCIKSDRQGSQFLKIYHTYKQLLQNGSALINTP